MKKSWITWTIIILVILLGIYIINRPYPETQEEVVKCIAGKSVLYSQLGCHACETQEEIFGENYKHIEVVDCFFEQNECIEKEIQGTPTWIINGEKHLGVQTIDELREITGC